MNNIGHGKAVFSIGKNEVYWYKDNINNKVV